MLPVVVLALLQYGSVVGQDGGCGDNLVQSLQQCAAAIKNNEPLSVQQEKCSPNGCNYDCPSTDALNGLRDEFMVLQQMVANNTNRIQALATQVDELHDYCGSTGWTKVAYLNMSDLSQDCPSAFRLYDQDGVRACGRQLSNTGSCDSVFFPSNGTSYSQVCGRVIGYQYASCDAFDIDRRPVQYTGINNAYVDGVSITYGNPREHIWTFAASINSNGQQSTPNYCPCDGSGTISAPNFVGEDYFCESGNPASQGWGFTLYVDDPIWDGKHCGLGEIQCCSTPSIPWFHKVLESPTTDDIELRICSWQHTGDEDSPISLYEIYIK